MPVLASSMTPKVFMRLRKASILSGVPVISTVKLSVETSMILPRKTSTQLMMSLRSLELGTLTFIKASSRMTKLPCESSLDFEDVDLFGDLFDNLVGCFFVSVDCYGHA